MVRHQAIRHQSHVTARTTDTQQAGKGRVVLVFVEHLRAPVATIHHVVTITPNIGSRGSWHATHYRFAAVAGQRDFPCTR